MAPARVTPQVWGRPGWPGQTRQVDASLLGRPQVEEYKTYNTNSFKSLHSNQSVTKSTKEKETKPKMHFLALTLIATGASALTLTKDLKAASPLVNLGCQCSSLTFVDSQGQVSCSCFHLKSSFWIFNRTVPFHLGLSCFITPRYVYFFFFTDRAEDPKHLQVKTIKTQVQVKTIKIYSQVQGNCRSVDSTGARWCYVDHLPSSCQVGSFRNTNKYWFTNKVKTNKDRFTIKDIKMMHDDAYVNTSTSSPLPARWVDVWLWIQTISVVPCRKTLTKWEVLDKHNFDYRRTSPTPQGSRPTRGLTKLAPPLQRTLATTTMSSLPTPPLSTTSLPTPCQLTNTSQPTLPQFTKSQLTLFQSTTPPPTTLLPSPSPSTSRTTSTAPTPEHTRMQVIEKTFKIGKQSSRNTFSLFNMLKSCLRAETLIETIFRSVCLQECSFWWNEDFLLIYALFLN